jgi:hypothetical protein
VLYQDYRVSEKEIISDIVIFNVVCAVFVVGVVVVAAHLGITIARGCVSPCIACAETDSADETKRSRQKVHQ